MHTPGITCRGPRWWTVALAGAALALVGCATQSDRTVKATDRTAPEASKAAPSASTTATPESATTANQPPAKPAPAPESSTAAKSAPAQPAAQRKGATPEERAKVAEQIRERMKGGGGSEAASTTKPAPGSKKLPTAKKAGEGHPAPNMTPTPTNDVSKPAAPDEKSKEPANPTTQPAAKDCHGNPVPPVASLTPPPPDQPQPKIVVDEPSLKVDVWRGEVAVFPFKIRNAGEGPLQIQIKGG